MENNTRALAATLLMGCVPAAFAANTVDLSVRGSITPASCTPSLSGGGIIDHGKLTAKDLAPEKPTALQTGTLILQVNCEAATFFTLTTFDNRSGSSAFHPSSHGLGMINDDQKLGSVAFGVFDPIADDVPVRTILSSNDGVSWRPSSYLGHAGLTAFAAQSDVTTPVAIKDLSTRLTVFTTIVRANDLTLVDEIPIDGHATVQLKYW
jgi:hypothetical protein